MAYFPVKARSELVTPANFSEGGVFETTRRFHDASPASMSPARRPTRGSGLGATVDMLPPPDDAHAARADNPTVRTRYRSDGEACTTQVMVESCEGNGTRGRTRTAGRISGDARRTVACRASAACVRFRWSDRRTRRRRTDRRAPALPRLARRAESPARSRP